MKNKNNIIGNPIVSEGFSALSFNLRFGLADDGVNNWDHRKKALPTLFEKYHPDFIGLQEANDFQIDYLAKILAGYDFIGKRSPAPSSWQNNVITLPGHLPWVQWSHQWRAH